MKDPSPGAEGARRKMASGSSEGKDVGGSLPPLIPNSDKPGYERHNGDPGDHPFQTPRQDSGGHGDQQKDNRGPGQGYTQQHGQQGQGKLGEIAGYVPAQRLEWKRYKQYTRTDIMAAIEEVKKGMSALQAARKYGVPSRTLYDKVKKMGITTGRQVQRKSLPNYPSQFPGLTGMMNVNDLEDRGDTNDSSVGTPGDGMDGRATMVPPSGLNYMIDFMKSRAEHYGNGNKSEGPSSEVSLTPMNLTTMLSNANKAKR